MSDAVRGSCQCGAVRFELTLPSRFCAHCHCRNCRKAHAAVFVTYVGVRSEQVATTGADAVTRYETDSGATRSFCSRCGTTLFYEGPRWPGEIHVALGCVDDPIDRAPSAHVYVDHRAAWWEITDALPRYGGPTGTEPRD